MFSSPQVLNRHCVSAHDTRHFGCSYCTDDFSSNDLLFAHMREHQIQCYLCYESVLTEEEHEKETQGRDDDHERNGE